MHQPQRVRFLVRIGRQPNVGHPAAIDQFLEIEPAERPWNRRFGGARAFRSPKHRIYLARPLADRYWFVRFSLSRLTWRPDLRKIRQVHNDYEEPQSEEAVEEAVEEARS